MIYVGSNNIPGYFGYFSGGYYSIPGIYSDKRYFGVQYIFGGFFALCFLASCQSFGYEPDQCFDGTGDGCGCHCSLDCFSTGDKKIFVGIGEQVYQKQPVYP